MYTVTESATDWKVYLSSNESEAELLKVSLTEYKMKER